MSLSKQRRRTIVRLTDKAEEILRRLTPAHLYEIREMAPELMLYDCLSRPGPIG